MADDRMTRFDVELFEAAADEGRREHRSARQQLEHWTRLGRELSAHETATRRRITSAVRGDIPFSDLATEERFVANVELDVAIRERAGNTSFGRALLKAGATAVALDDNGVLTLFDPDGGTRPLEAGQPAVAGSARARRRPE
jgi:ParD-like antitoxin of type II bacterial toxin-antitoxin system